MAKKKATRSSRPARKPRSTPRQGRAKSDTTSPADLPDSQPPSIPFDSALTPQLPGGLATLLPCPTRRPLPEFPESKGGRTELLVDIIQHTPEVYAKLIMLIRMGSTLGVAAERCAISQTSFYEWGARGRHDSARNLDTFYSRFYADVRRAVATRRSEVEMQLAEDDPKFWLGRGPGRLFDHNWSDAAQKQLPSGAADNDQHRLPDPNSREVIDAAFSPSPSLPQESLPAPDADGDVQDAEFTKAEETPGPRLVNMGGRNVEIMPISAEELGSVLSTLERSRVITINTQEEEVDDDQQPE